MTTIVFNGESKQVSARTLAELLAELETGTERCAVAVNEAFVPRCDYHITTLESGDQIELLVPMQGG